MSLDEVVQAASSCASYSYCKRFERVETGVRTELVQPPDLTVFPSDHRGSR
jgi:hypothetical protein